MSNTLKKSGLFWGTLFTLTFSQAVLAVQEDCDYATDLLFYAYHLHDQGGDAVQQKLLFNNYLRFCRNQPTVHSALASILKKQGKYSEAIYHYKQALELRPKFFEAWYGLGETYYKQERFSLSLEAYSYVCKINDKAKTRIITLLRDKRYATTDKGKVIDKESLLVLYNSERRDALNKRLSKCGFRDNEVQPLYIFTNLYFETKTTTLAGAKTKHQLDEIAAALQETHSSQIINIYGHADSRPFLNLSLAESKQRNLQLSLERAAVVVPALTQRGVSKTRIKIYGHGNEDPIAQGKSPEALAINRRTEIEVEPVVTQKSIDEY